MITIAMILFILWIIYKYFKSKSSENKNKEKLIIKGKIETELIPMAMHGKNVRSRIDYKLWMKIAHKSHSLNRNKFNTNIDECEVCRGNGKQQGFKHQLEAHEQWSFDDHTRTQKLTRIQSLCPMCHKVVHIGLADKQGFGDRARMHMMAVNGWTIQQVEAHIDQARQTVRQMRSVGMYKLDLTYLNNSDYAQTHDYQFTKNETNNCKPNVYE